VVLFGQKRRRAAFLPIRCITWAGDRFFRRGGTETEGPNRGGAGGGPMSMCSFDTGRSEATAAATRMPGSFTRPA
jgi:hypothetical protein